MAIDLFLLACVAASQAPGAKPVRNEMVMTPGMTIVATTASGKMAVRAIDDFTRSYTWEGATRAEELSPRATRWYGSLGASSPGAGDHWRPHHGITRGVLSEGQQRFKTVGQALKWIKAQGWQPYAYRDDGLFVGWGKVLERRQLNVDVVQIYVNGRKPTRLPGSRNRAIVVLREAPPSPKTSLVEAVRRNDYASAKRLVEKQANPNVRNAIGTPMLAVAAAKGYRAVARLLLDAGADPNLKAVDQEEATPLLLAQDPGIVGLLIAKGADPNASYARGTLTGHTKLMSAAMDSNVRLVRALLDAGANPSQAARDGETALHGAASQGDLAVAKILIERGAVVDARDFLGRTPLMNAATFGARRAGEQGFELVRFLIAKGANVDARLDATRLAYYRAAFVGDEATAQRIERSGKLDVLTEDGPSVLDQTQDERVRAILRAAGAKG